MHKSILHLTNKVETNIGASTSAKSFGVCIPHIRISPHGRSKNKIATTTQNSCFVELLVCTWFRVAWLSLFECLGEGSRSCIVWKTGQSNLSTRGQLSQCIARAAVSSRGCRRQKDKLLLCCPGQTSAVADLFVGPGLPPALKLGDTSAVLPALFGAIISSRHGYDLLIRLSVALLVSSACVCSPSCPWSEQRLSLMSSQ